MPRPDVQPRTAVTRRAGAPLLALCALTLATGYGLLRPVPGIADGLALTISSTIATASADTQPAELYASTQQHAPPTADPMHGDPVDLQDIRFQRDFRILVAPPDGGAQSSSEAMRIRIARARLLEKFADENFLIPVWVPVERSGDLAEALLDGRGDVIASPMPTTRFALDGVSATVPVGTLHERLVVRAGERIDGPLDLAHREVALRPRSGFWPEMNRLMAEVPGLRARVLDTHMTDVEVYNALRAGALDLAVLDVDPVRVGEAPLDDLRVIETVGSITNLSYGVRPGSPALRLALDEFLARERLAAREHARYVANWKEIKRRGLLRVITRNNAATFFIWRGRPVGFEYELLAKFARKHGLSLQMVVPQGRDELVPALRDGRGDIIAASMVVTDARRARGLDFTRAYKTGQLHFVTRVGEPPVHVPQDLAGRTVSVRRSSAAWARLEELQRTGVAFRLEAGPEHLETEDYIEQVGNGTLDVTVADSYSVKVALAWRSDVVSSMPLSGPLDVGWAVRRGNAALLDELNTFIAEEYRQVEYNMLHARYFGNEKRVRAHVTQRADGINGAALSPYDELVQLHAGRHGFDWPLIVAQMFRESRFRPDARSLAGAQGLMQVLPVTARRFGISDLRNPDRNIAAGVKLMSWTYRRLEAELPVRERIWFTLAAYNAGLGHLIDARALARKLGLDANRWFDNVEKAMLLLAKPEYYRKARHGYVRGREPVAYVRDIRDLYDAYRSLLRS
jgi:membrane-bound lytic murein transglycosylase F